MNQRKIIKVISVVMVICFAFSGCKASDEEQNTHFTNELIKYKDGDKWGVIDINENIIVPAAYKDVEIIDDGYILVENEDNYHALVSPKGEFLTGFDYYNLMPYTSDNQLIPFFKSLDEDSYCMGYLNFEGEVAIEPIYEGACDFRDGLAMVIVNRKYGIINTKGEYVVEPIYDYVKYDDAGYIYRRKDDKWEILDREGNLAIDGKYDEVCESNKDGYVIVRVYDEYEEVPEDYGLINEKGEYVLLPIYNHIHFADDEHIVFAKDRKYGIADCKGNIIVEPTYDKIYDFIDGVALFEQDNKYGYINNKGEVIVKPTCEWPNDFSENLVAIKQGDKWGYLNDKGDVVVEPIYDWAYDFSNGLAKVEKDGRVGYINTSGNVIIPLEYLEGSFCDDEGYVVVAMTNEKFTIINKNNEKLLKKEYDCLSYDMQHVSFCIEEQCSQHRLGFKGYYCEEHKIEKGYCGDYFCTNRREEDSNYCSTHSNLEIYD